MLLLTSQYFKLAHYKRTEMIANILMC